MSTPFELDQARLDAAQGLPLNQFDEFQRLAKSLLHGPAFQLLLLDCPQDALRRDLGKRLEQALASARLQCTRLHLNARIADAAVLELRLGAQQAQAVQVLGGASWFTPERWDDLNQRRERLAQTGRRLMLWLDATSIVQMSQHAPDLWSWRAGIYAFTSSPAPATALLTSQAWNALPWDSSLSMVQRHRRIAQLREMLARPAPPEDDLRAPLLNELAQLLTETGQLDEALRVRREEELPIYQRLGNIREQALAMGKIADILEDRGELDEALRIYREEELPIYERLGDAREKALTMGRIADILHARGQHAESLRIRREQELPVFQHLGDVQSQAITMGKIADIMQDRGQFEEAMRIRQEQQLPIFEQLGDIRSKALTMGKIAGVLRAQGQLDEALRILRDEELPIFERLGDMRELAVVQANLAICLVDRGQPGDLHEARSLLSKAHAAAYQMGLAETQTIADLLHGLPAA